MAQIVYDQWSVALCCNHEFKIGTMHAVAVQTMLCTASPPRYCASAPYGTIVSAGSRALVNCI